MSCRVRLVPYLIFCSCFILFAQFLVSPIVFAHASSASYQYYLDQLALKGEKECIQPPKNVNLMSLSDAQLQLYGLPTHQTLDSNPQKWSEELSHAKRRICGTSSSNRHHKTHHQVSGGRNSDNWAGNEDTGNRGTYSSATVTFTIPNEAPGENQYGGRGSSADDDASFWAGVGGDNGITSSAVVVQAGVDTQWTGFSQYNVSWWEVAPNIPTEQNLPLCNLDTGSQVYIFVDSNLYNDGNDYFYIANNSSSCYNSHTDTNHRDFSDSATGECIAERPLQSGNVYFGLVDYGSIRFIGCDINGTPINTQPHIYYNLVSLQTGDTLETVGPVARNNTDYTVYWHWFT